MIQNPGATLSGATICNGQSTTLNALPNGANYLWSPGGATTQSLLVNPTTTTNYTVTVSIGGCAATTATAVVTVNPIPTITVGVDQTICNGLTAVLTSTPSPAGGTYLWSPSGQTTQSLSLAPSLTSPLVAQDFTQTLVYTLNNCSSVADTGIIHVNPIPTASVSNQTICNQGTAILTPVVAPAGGTYAWSPSGQTTTQNTVNPTATTTYSLIYTLNGCNSLPAAATVTVNPNPTIAVNSQTICNGESAILTATPNQTGGSYYWLPGGQISQSITVSPSVTSTYSCIYTLNGCSSDTISGTVTVKPVPSLSLSDTTICEGFSVNLTALTNIPNGAFSWSPGGQNTQGVSVSPAITTVYTVNYTAPNGCAAIPDQGTVTVIQNPGATLSGDTICNGLSTTLNALPNGANYSWSPGGATTQSLLVSPTTTTNYTVTVSIGGCAASTATATVTVTPIPTITAATGATICNGQSTTIGTNVSAPGGTYAWTPSGTSSSLTVTPTLSSATTQQTFNYSVVYTLNGCPSFPPSLSTVTVNPKPTVSVNNPVFCSGSNGTIEANPNLPGGQFNWSTGLSGTSDSLLNVSHVTNPVNQLTFFTYDSWYILNGCSSDTVTSTVQVNPIPTLTSSNSPPICSGETLNISLNSNVLGSTFNWVALDNANVNGESLVSQPFSTINNTLTNNTPNSQTVDYVVTPTFNGCDGIPQTISVMVNPKPFINPINEIICSGGSFDTIPNSLAVGNNIPSNTTYTWNFVDNTSVVGEANNPVASTNIFGGPLSSILQTNTPVTYTVTPYAAPCIGSNFNVNITITATPEIVDKTISICSGNYPTITAASNDIIPATTLYTWIISTNNSAISGQSAQVTPISNLNNQVLVNSTSSTQQIIYEVTPQSGPCQGLSFNLTVNVNPGPNLSSATYEICSNSSLSSLILGSPNDIIPIGTQYTWTVVGNPNVNGETNNSIPSPTFNTGLLLNLTNSDKTVIYTILPIGPSTLQPQCNGATFQLTVIVHPTPVLPNVTLPNICSGSGFTFNPVANPLFGSIFNTNTILNWTVAPNTNVSGYADYSGINSSIINQNLINNTDVVQAVVYNVTAIDTTSDCSSIFTVTINVYPRPNIQNQTADICTGTPFNVVPLSLLPSQIVPSGITYSWINPVSNPIGVITGGAAQNNQPSISQLLTNPGSSDATLEYTVVPTYVVSPSLTCIGPNFTVTVIVRPKPTVIANALEPVICPGDNTTLNAVGSPNVNSSSLLGSYNWTPIAQLVGAANTISVTAQPASTTTYSVVYTLSGCSSQPYPVTVTVQSPPNISTFTALETSICSGGFTQLSANFTGNTVVDYVIWSNGVTTYSAPHTILVSPTSTTVYTATAYLLNCGGVPSNITINVNPDPTILTQPLDDTTICVGGSYPLTVAVANGAGTPQYQWYSNINYSNIGGTLIPGATNPNYTPPSFNVAGDYFYYCKIIYIPNGCDSIKSNPSRISVINDPVVQIIGGNQNLCIGGSTDCLNAVVSGGIGNTTYVWSPLSGSNSVYCPPNSQVGSTIYSVGVVQTGIGCSSNSINSITVNIVDDPIITIIGITAACEGAIIPLSTIVTGGIGNVVQYEWQEANPIGSPYLPIVNSNSNNYTTLPLLNDVGYSVSIIQSGNGCAATDIHAIMIYDDPQLNLIGSPYSCLGEETSITANILGGTPSSTNSLTWYAYPAGVINPLIIQGPNNDLTYDFLLTGDTTIYVESVNSGFGCDLVTESITIQGLTPAVASFEVSNTIQSLIDPTFSFTNTSENATDYFWNLGECDPQAPASELFTTPTPFYNPTNQDQMEYTYGCAPGLYQIMLIAYNQGICPDTAYQVIQIQDGVSVYIPNTFTPDGDMTNQYFFPVISSIISPNTFLFSIYNRWGEEVFISKDPNEKWDGNNYITNNKCQDGVYIWKLRFIMKESGEVINKVGHVNLLR